METIVRSVHGKRIGGHRAAGAQFQSYVRGDIGRFKRRKEQTARNGVGVLGRDHHRVGRGAVAKEKGLQAGRIDAAVDDQNVRVLRLHQRATIIVIITHLHNAAGLRRNVIDERRLHDHGRRQEARERGKHALPHVNATAPKKQQQIKTNASRKRQDKPFEQ